MCVKWGRGWRSNLTVWGSPGTLAMSPQWCFLISRRMGKYRGKRPESLLPSHRQKLFWWNRDLDKTILCLRLFGTGPVNYWRTLKISYTCSSVVFDPAESNEVLNALESGLWLLTDNGEQILKWSLYQHLSECSRVTQFTRIVSGQLQNK